MGINSIGSRAAGSFGKNKINRNPITDDTKQLEADAWNKVVNAVIELQTSHGTADNPDPSSHEARIIDASTGEAWTSLITRVGIKAGERRAFFMPGNQGPGFADWYPGDSTVALAGVVGGPSSGRWKRVMLLTSPAVDITWLGAKDDGSNDCSALVSAYIAWRVPQFAGKGGTIVLHIPHASPGGYFRFDYKVTAPGAVGVKLVIRGHGGDVNSRAPFGRNDQHLSTTNAFGSVCRFTSTTEDAFGGDLSNAYSALELEGLVIVGPGRGLTAGVDVNGLGNLQILSRNNTICNFYQAFRHINGISAKNHTENRSFGCFVGEHLQGTTDSNWFGPRIEGCNVGIWIQAGYGIKFYGSLTQGCANGIRWGGPAVGGANGYGINAIRGNHFEANGIHSGQFNRADCVTVTTANDSLSGLAARNSVTPTAGQRVLVAGQTDKTKNGPYLAASGSWTRADLAIDTHAGCLYKITGGTYANTYWQIDNTAPAFLDDGNQLKIARTTEDWDMQFAALDVGGSRGTTTVEDGSMADDSWCDGKQLNLRNTAIARLNVGGGEFVETSGLMGPGMVTVAVTSHYYRRSEYPYGFGGYGTYTHDWANAGDQAKAQLTANLTIAAPTNARDGAIVRYMLVQDSVGGRVVSWSGVYRSNQWSNAGNSGGCYAFAELQMMHGAWVMVRATPWGIDAT